MTPYRHKVIVVLLSALFPSAAFAAPKPAELYIAPYGGYHWFGDKAESSVEIGGKIGIGVAPRISLEAGVDFIPTIQNDIGTSRTDVMRYAVDIRYDWDKGLVKRMPLLSPFAFAGLTSDLSDFNNGVDGHIAIGLRHPISAISDIETSYVMGSERSFRVSIRRPFSTFRRKPRPIIPTPTVDVVVTPHVVATPASVIDSVPTPQPILPPSPNESARLTFADSLYQFDMKTPRLVDMAIHWAKPDATYATSIGLMDIREGSRFFPNQEVTHGEMTKMVIYAAYLHRLRQQMAMNIAYRVMGVSDESYDVTLEVLNRDGQVVATLLDHSAQEAGAHMLSWRGLDDDGKMVAPGDYQVRLAVYKNDTQISLDTRPVKVIRVTEALFNIRKPGLDFGPVIAPTIRDTIFNNSRDQGILTLKTNGDVSFSKRPVAKVEFVVSIAKALLILGAERENTGDYKTHYRDWDQIPEYSREYLDVYVSELGYYGTKRTRQFQPNKHVSRAEAATLLTRLLNWQPMQQ